jgi:hypothetical protein
MLGAERLSLVASVREACAVCRIFSGMIGRRFSKGVESRLQELTRGDSERCTQYIDRVADSDDEAVIAVNIADLLHNTQPGRLPRCSDDRQECQYISRLYRYDCALEKITLHRAWLNSGSWRCEQRGGGRLEMF